jgi:exopolyphosphatase/guanosine-5'-triphosphate,3'-diphosphate pyrophosphatase
MARRAATKKVDATTAQRPLELDTDRAVHAERRPYAIVDIGSNSVRLVVYDELGRAPLPRFNEKSMCRLGEGLAETGQIAAENFRRTVEAVRRFRAIADAMGVTRLDATATEAVRRASNGPALVDAIACEAGLEIRVLSGAEEAHFAAQGVISGLFRPVGLVGDMGGGSLELAEALDDRVGDRWVSLPLGALPVESLLKGGAASAKASIDEQLRTGLPPVLTEPVFYAVGGGFRALAKAHLCAANAPVRVIHGYAVRADTIRAFAKKLWHTAPDKLAAMPGVATRRAPTLPAAAIVLDRVIKHLGPERVVFSALGLREGWLYAQLPEAERYLDPLVEGAQLFGLPLARVPAFAAALGRWTDNLFPGEVAADRRLRLAVCAVSDLAWRDHPDVRAEESFRRLLQFPFIGIDHAERVFMALAIHARYAGGPEARWLEPAVSMLSSSLRRRAMILGRTLLLGYRFSGGVPEILAEARLHIDADIVRLEVGSAGRVPDSEVVGDRLRLLASAIGVRRTEIVEAG